MALEKIKINKHIQFSFMKYFSVSKKFPCTIIIFLEFFTYITLYTQLKIAWNKSVSQKVEKELCGWRLSNWKSNLNTLFSPYLHRFTHCIINPFVYHGIFLFFFLVGSSLASPFRPFLWFVYIFLTSGKVSFVLRI